MVGLHHMTSLHSCQPASQSGAAAVERAPFFLIEIPWTPLPKCNYSIRALEETARYKLKFKSEMRTVSSSARVLIAPTRPRKHGMCYKKRKEITFINQYFVYVRLFPTALSKGTFLSFFFTFLSSHKLGGISASNEYGASGNHIEVVREGALTQ